MTPPTFSCLEGVFLIYFLSISCGGKHNLLTYIVPP